MRAARRLALLSAVFPCPVRQARPGWRAYSSAASAWPSRSMRAGNRPPKTTSRGSAAGARSYAARIAGSRPASPPGFIARIRRGSRLPARCVRRAAADTASSATCASRRSTTPASVSATARLVRSSRVTPSRRSSCRTVLDSAGCAMPSRAAARPKCSSSATARKYASSRVSSRSIPPGYRSQPGRSWTYRSRR